MPESADPQDTEAPGPPLEEARARLEEAEGLDSNGRLEVLEALYAELQEELDAGKAPSAGR